MSDAAPTRLPNAPNGDAAYWLGQAGFWIDLGGTRILIDPYLSDSLAEKYVGTRFPHTRMMDIPIRPKDLPRPDIVLITHAHTDHMDPVTLAELSARHPNLTYVVPAAETPLARERLGDTAQLRSVVSGDSVNIGGVSITVFPSAHEDRKRDVLGRDHYLGYGITAGDTRLYHSGDTVPFAALTHLLKDFAPDIAFLPINGRDEQRARHGVPGNMTIQEAIALCVDCKIPRLIPHHFGLFDFNTASAAELELAENHGGPPAIKLPSPLARISLSSP